MRFKTENEQSTGKERLARVADLSYPALMKTLSVKLPEPLAEWLLEESRTKRRSRSELVREALELRRRGDKNGKSKPLTMAEAMADLRGSVRGKRDLSTNPKYMEGFGE